MWQTLFDFTNVIALGGWALLILLPRRESVLACVLYGGVGLLCATYLVMLVALVGNLVDPAPAAGTAPNPAFEYSVEGLMAMFRSEAAIVVGWTHYLALDLFAGLWIARDADGRAVGRLMQVPFLLATFMAGLILLVAGWFRAGRLIAFIPEAVVNGFTIGIAIIIATSQISDFFGLTVSNVPADFIEKLPVLWEARETASLAALAIALVTLVLIIVLRKAAPKYPGLIVAVGLGSAAVAFMNLPVDTLYSRFGALPNHLPMPHLPEISWGRLVELLPSAIIIAFLAGVESLLSAMVADRMIGGHHRPNAELTAQGAANLASSLFGGLPATGAIARTATNVRAGGKTPVAGIVHALVILLIMLVAAPLAGYLAMPALAALLAMTAWNMSEPHKWGEYVRAGKSDLALMMLTMVLTVLVDLTVAIGVGVAVGLALRLSRRTDESDWTPREH